MEQALKLAGPLALCKYQVRKVTVFACLVGNGARG